MLSARETSRENDVSLSNFTVQDLSTLVTHWAMIVDFSSIGSLNGRMKLMSMT